MLWEKRIKQERKKEWKNEKRKNEPTNRRIDERTNERNIFSPGSKKAVGECFGFLLPVLRHAVDLVRDRKPAVKLTHDKLQGRVQEVELRKCRITASV